MSKRFIWNFEIETQTPSLLQKTEIEDVIDLHWEFRYFWNSHEFITLQGLNESFLDLKNYKIKYKKDSYYLLPDFNYNLKMRDDSFFYKPMLGKTHNAIAYGKKINLNTEPLMLELPSIPNLNTNTLQELMLIHGKKIIVEKEALVHRFDTHPKTKLELAKLRIGQDTYYSISIESPSCAQVTGLTQHVLGDMQTCDYVTFLRSR